MKLSILDLRLRLTLSLKLHCDLWYTDNFNVRCIVQTDIKSKTHVMELRYEIFHFRLKIEANIKSKTPL